MPFLRFFQKSLEPLHFCSSQQSPTFVISVKKGQVCFTDKGRNRFWRSAQPAFVNRHFRRHNESSIWSLVGSRVSLGIWHLFACFPLIIGLVFQPEYRSEPRLLRGSELAESVQVSRINQRL